MIIHSISTVPMPRIKSDRNAWLLLPHQLPEITTYIVVFPVRACQSPAIIDCVNYRFPTDNGPSPQRPPLSAGPRPIEKARGSDPYGKDPRAASLTAQSVFQNPELILFAI